ncbi:HalOD1 output domain-containing protein [Haladaptatus sp. NG-SE-30]
MTRRNTSGGTTGNDSSTIDGGSHWTQVAQRHYDPAQDGELTTALVFAIAEAEGVAPSEVTSPPVYECIDAAALEETFFGPAVAGEDRQGVGTVEFQYTEYRVTVGSGGWIQVYESTDADRS